MKHINASGHAMLVENSNQGHGAGPPRGLPNNTVAPGWCNFNIFRSGGASSLRLVESLLVFHTLDQWRHSEAVLNFGLDKNEVFTHLSFAGDIGPDFMGTVGRLQRTIPFQDLKDPISRPGCWAYRECSHSQPNSLSLMASHNHTLHANSGYARSWQLSGAAEHD